LLFGCAGRIAFALQHKSPEKLKNARLSVWYTSLHCTKSGRVAALVFVAIWQQDEGKVISETSALQEVDDIGCATLI
jgi:EAL domain-containing protein (putative c-di-GMP-specific phosphodiesterase class I)